MAALADDFGARIKELRNLLGESQEEFGARWGRAGKQIGVWENEGQRPRWRTVLFVAAKQGWPSEMFEKDGPRPGVALKRSVNGRTVREGTSSPFPSPKPPAGLSTYREAIRELTGYLDREEPVPAAVAIKLLSEVYAATRPVSGAVDADADAVPDVEDLSQTQDEDRKKAQETG